MLSLASILHTCKPVVTIPDQNEVEFLNSLEPPGLPPHILPLKVRSPVKLIHNLEPERLWNGSRLVIKKMISQVISLSCISLLFRKSNDIFIQKFLLFHQEHKFHSLSEDCNSHFVSVLLSPLTNLRVKRSMARLLLEDMETTNCKYKNEILPASRNGTSRLGLVSD